MIRIIGTKQGNITTPLSDSSTILGVDAALWAYLDYNIDFSSDYIYLTLSEGLNREEVKVTGLGVGTLVIERAQGDTDPQTFTIAARYDTDINKAAAQDIAAGVAPVAPLTLTGVGAATINDLGGGAYEISVAQPIIEGASGVEVASAFPNYTVALINNGGCCEGDAPVVDTTVNIVGVGIVDAELVSGIWNITVAPPNFTGVGVSITGSWPDLTFTVAAGAGGTVTSVGAGTGLSLTGSPAVNPTLSITNTGATAGVYGDITFNAQGQATDIAPTFDPISSIVAGDGIAVSRTGGEVTVAMTPGAEGVVGGLALADSGDPLDDTDVTTAVSPALLAAVIADLEGATPYGGQSYSGEADADYSNIVPTTAITLDLAAGEKALVFVNITVRDGAAPATPVNYGIAVFDAAANRIQANRLITQSEQTMIFMMTGAFSSGLILCTTVLPGGSTVISQSITAIKF